MNKEDITNALNELDDEILEKTEEFRDKKTGNAGGIRQRNRIGRILAAAAAIVVLIGGTILIVSLIRGREETPAVTTTAPGPSSEPQDFTGTEIAENTETTENTEESTDKAPAEERSGQESTEESSDQDKSEESTDPSSTEDPEEEKYHTVVYDEGYRMISRFEAYQPGVNDIQIFLENTSDHTLTVSNSVTLEIEVQEGSGGTAEYAVVPMGEHYRKALEERGIDIEGSRQGTTIVPVSTDSSSILPVFWSAHFMTEEDGPLAPGNYRLKVIINEKEQYFPFRVAEDGWDGKPHSIEELSAATAVRYKEKIYYRPTASQDSPLSYEEANIPALEYLGQAELTDARERLAKDLDAYRLDDRWAVYYDAANDRLLIGNKNDEKSNYTVLRNTVEVKDTENWK